MYKTKHLTISKLNDTIRRGDFMKNFMNYDFNINKIALAGNTAKATVTQK